MFQVRNLTAGEQATEDRRAAPRLQVIYRLDVITPSGNIGCMLDISSSGMRVRFKQALDMGATQTLRVEFPRWLELGDGLETRGRFAWLRATTNGGTEAGFSFDSLSRKEGSLLTVLIQRLAEALAEDQAATS